MALDKIGIAKRIAQELDRYFVNLESVFQHLANYIPDGIDVEFQSGGFRHGSLPLKEMKMRISSTPENKP
jgi:hypothetical protein